MDKLETRLREDASRIDTPVSPELEARIRASLESVSARPDDRRRPGISLWWASSLTGLAAAAAVVVAINLGPAERPPATTGTVLPEPLVAPVLRVESAVLTKPLEEELEDLEADLQKARDAVRKDIGLRL